MRELDLVHDVCVTKEGALNVVDLLLHNVDLYVDFDGSVYTEDFYKVAEVIDFYYAHKRGGYHFLSVKYLSGVHNG